MPCVRGGRIVDHDLKASRIFVRRCCAVKLAADISITSGTAAEAVEKSKLEPGCRPGSLRV